MSPPGRGSSSTLSSSTPSRAAPRRGIEGVEFATLDRVDRFNHHGLLEPIGHVPPAEAEAECYATQDILPLAA